MKNCSFRGVLLRWAAGDHWRSHVVMLVPFLVLLPLTILAEPDFPAGYTSLLVLLGVGYLLLRWLPRSETPEPPASGTAGPP